MGFDRAVKLAGAFVAGGVLAATGLWLGRATAGGEVPVVGSTTTTTSATEPRFGPTRVYAEAFDDAGGFVFRYRLDALGGPDSHPIAVPELWRLTLDDGTTIVGRTANADARTVRFNAESGEEIDPFMVSEVAVTQWRLQTPLEYEIELDVGGALRPVLDDGTKIWVVRTLVQSDATLVQFGFELGRDGFDSQFGGAPVFLGEGPEWRGIEVVSGGSWRPQLDYLGGELPDPFTLKVLSSSWQPIPAEVVVDIEDIR